MLWFMVQGPSGNNWISENRDSNKAPAAIYYRGGELH